MWGFQSQNCQGERFFDIDGNNHIQPNIKIELQYRGAILGKTWMIFKMERPVASMVSRHTC